MHLAFLIRHEREDDIAGIRAVVEAAFGREGEADLVDGLREADALTISAVAVSSERIIGHVAFSPVTIGENGPALALAPAAVAPEFQGKGVGRMLIHWALDECQRAGHELVIVVGSAKYYPRFGFVPAAKFGIQCPFPVASESFMALELVPGAADNCEGMVRYHPEFDKV